MSSDRTVKLYYGIPDADGEFSLHMSDVSLAIYFPNSVGFRITGHSCFNINTYVTCVQGYILKQKISFLSNQLIVRQANIYVFAIRLTHGTRHYISAVVFVNID